MVSQKSKYCKNFERNSHWKILSMIMVWERYCNASPKPAFLLFSLFIFSFMSQLIWVCLGWNFHSWFSIQEQVNGCTVDPFSLKFCTSQHSYPVPLKSLPTLYFKRPREWPLFLHVAFNILSSLSIYTAGSSWYKILDIACGKSRHSSALLNVQ